MTFSLVLEINVLYVLTVTHALCYCYHLELCTVDFYGVRNVFLC